MVVVGLIALVGCPEAVAPCADCVGTIAAAVVHGPPIHGANLGYRLALFDDAVLAIAPVPPDAEAVLGRGYVRAFDLPTLTPRAAWLAADPYDSVQSLAVADVDGDGAPEVAIGQPWRNFVNSDRSGVATLLPGMPTGADRTIPAGALAEFQGIRGVDAGSSVGFGALGPTDRLDWLVAGYGSQRGGAVYALDPARRGVLVEADAERVLRGQEVCCRDLAVWDANQDGKDDLVVLGVAGLSVFVGPWQADMDFADRNHVLEGWGDGLALLGDVTGDGAPDVGVSAPEHPDPGENAGRGYVVSGDDLGGALDGLSIRVQGRYPGQRMGGTLAGGDIDGDGQHDLLVGAYGWVWGFRGPLGAGAIDETDASDRLRSDHGNDLWHAALLMVDADGDAQADVVVGAPGWPGFPDAWGAVYLVLGADWVP